jgi:2-keto-4-pentenoate hydratase
MRAEVGVKHRHSFLCTRKPQLADSHSVSAAAIELAQRRLKGQTGPLLDAARPKAFEQAFSLQQAVAEQYCRLANTQIGGWKCLLPQGDKLVVAPIFADSILSSGSQQISRCPLWPSARGLARVEPELAFTLVKDLPSRSAPYANAEIDAALGPTRLALELIFSRYSNPGEASYFDALADGLVNQGLLLGPELDLAMGTQSGPDLSKFTLTLDIQSGDMESGGCEGERSSRDAMHPNKDPRAALYWLVNFLSQRGIGMAAGQRVITGSYAGVLDLPLGQEIRLGFGELGRFSVFFEARR